MDDLRYETKLKMLGLREIAREHQRAIDGCAAALQSLTGDPEEYGLCSDWLQEDTKPEVLWSNTAKFR
jgi:hypothetical protein